MRIVNKRSHTRQPGDVYVGRPSVLGNPFEIGRDGDRETVIAKYRVWLRVHAIETGGPVRDAMRALRPDSTLVCWCAPLPCHAAVIAELYAEMLGR